MAKLSHNTRLVLATLLSTSLVLLGVTLGWSLMSHSRDILGQEQLAQPSLSNSDQSIATEGHSEENRTPEMIVPDPPGAPAFPVPGGETP